MARLTNEIVIAKAKELGFDMIGFAKVEQLNKETERLKQWLENGYHASMDYMKKNIEKRFDVRNILPEAKSVISLAINYYKKDQHINKNGFGKISRYAWGKDYHLIIWEKLELLEDELKDIDPEFISKSYVDTGPVMDKVWAVKAGIGWMGKHTNVITREIGSWIFLAEMITNYEFDYNEPITDYCGTCRACIDACPTDAIVEEYVVDANKCISFLTIENKNEIPENFKGKFDNWIFGCDICQEVCPWNKKFSKPNKNHEFNSVENKELKIDEILEMTEEEFKVKFQSSPISRAKLNGLKRNAKFLIS
ncbi:tRNA epoxyqueuosine(34) reductase QueG [Rosettibacter firmus]|uniref:tRNA epoxyqueuosine(34) reductase QueG n=1 Tax=Rosettibacter firmus TaxID=3111522 RepID=UPI00336BDCD3